MYSLFFFFLCLCFCFLSCLFFNKHKKGVLSPILIIGGACPGCPPESTPMEDFYDDECSLYFLKVSARIKFILCNILPGLVCIIYGTTCMKLCANILRRNIMCAPSFLVCARFTAFFGSPAP